MSVEEYSSPETEPTFADPAPAVPRPHLGWTAVFIAINLVAQVIVLIVLGLVSGRTGQPHASAAATSKAPATAGVVFMNIASCVATLAIAWPTLQMFWGRPFWKVLAWNREHIRGKEAKLAVLGFAASIVATMLQHQMTLPKDMPIDMFFRNPSIIWWLTLYGAIVAPLFEETLFRGFLLPAIAIAIDWLRRRPLPDYLTAADGLSKSSLAVSSVLTSIAFGSIHAQQLAHAWNVVALLSCVGLVLAWVRLRYRSLAASALVHCAYNSTLFIAMFIATGGYRHLDRMGHR